MATTRKVAPEERAEEPKPVAHPTQAAFRIAAVHQPEARRITEALEPRRRKAVCSSREALAVVEVRARGAAPVLFPILEVVARVAGPTPVVALIQLVARRRLVAQLVTAALAASTVHLAAPRSQAVAIGSSAIARSVSAFPLRWMGNLVTIAISARSAKSVARGAVRAVAAIPAV